MLSAETFPTENFRPIDPILKTVEVLTVKKLCAVGWIYHPAVTSLTYERRGLDGISGRRLPIRGMVVLPC